MNKKTDFRYLIAIGCLLTFGVTSGCGNSNPRMFEVSGSVTYQGKPVKAGEIIFAPDTEKGNAGPGGYAVIQNGQFTTKTSKGVFGGAYVLTIRAQPHGVGESEIDQAFASSDMKFELFPTQEMPFDLPRENTTLDIEIPVVKNE